MTIEAVWGTAGTMVCVIRGADGSVTGSTSVRAAPFPGAPGRQLWALELHGSAQNRFRELLTATWRVLDAAADGSGPEGLVAFPDTPDPTPQWQDPRTLLVGYTGDGREARMAPFNRPPPPEAMGFPPVDPPYRIVSFVDSGVSPEDVVALWLRETGLDAEEAHRRLSEVKVVAVSRDGELVGVGTCYLQINQQLRLPLWYARVLVVPAHRRELTGLALAIALRDGLEADYVSGRDRRALGFLGENEHPGLKAVTDLVWPHLDTVFIGENARGDHVRVYYFDGARRLGP